MPPTDERVADDVAVLRELAASLAVAAGRAALAGRRAEPSTSGLDSTTKSSQTDIVTRFDRAAETTIVDGIRQARPNDSIVGEEGTDRVGDSGYAWYVDPIDGTTNFVYDLPTWSCSVAVAFEGRTVAGAVYVPALDELFAAAAGHGATMNGRPIAPSTETVLGRALVATGFSYDADRRRRQAALIADVIGDVRDIRRLGSAALDLCFVAAGRFDAYLERHLNAWDVAAGVLIAREAGAITSDFAGSEAHPGEILAAAPGVHAALVGLLAPL